MNRMRDESGESGSGFAFLAMSHLRCEEGKFDDDWDRDDDNEEE